MKSDKKLTKMVLTAMMLALSLVLPFLTAQLKSLGNAFCPMHIPVILCGFLCGPFYGLFIGFIAPILRFFLFGMPPIMPIGIAMSFELATYGFISGLLFRIFPRRKKYIYVTLIISMLAGRIIWGVTELILMGLGKTEFGIKIFVSSAFLNAIPGIVIQLVLIPILVMTLKRNFYRESR